MWGLLVHLAAITFSVYEVALRPLVAPLEIASRWCDMNWPVITSLAMIALYIMAVHFTSRLDLGESR